MSHPDDGEIVFAHARDRFADAPIEVDHGIKSHLDRAVNICVGEVISEEAKTLSLAFRRRRDAFRIERETRNVGARDYVIRDLDSVVGEGEFALKPFAVAGLDGAGSCK